MIGTMAENLKVVAAVVPASYGAGTTYNGVASASGIGIDTLGFDEALIIVNAGTTTGSGTLDITVLSTNDNTALAATGTAITGAVFAQITADNDNAVYVGKVKCKDVKRYLLVKSVAATAATIYGVTVVLGKADSVPTGQAVTF